jgi:limonene-1,2-epoxide hydrolase
MSEVKFQEFNDPFSLALFESAREIAHREGLDSKDLLEGFKVDIKDMKVDGTKINPRSIPTTTYFEYDGFTANHGRAKIAFASYHAVEKRGRRPEIINFHFQIFQDSVEARDLVRERIDFFTSPEDFDPIARTAQKHSVPGKYHVKSTPTQRGKSEPPVYRSHLPK